MNSLTFKAISSEPSSEVNVCDDRSSHTFTSEEGSELMALNVREFISQEAQSVTVSFLTDGSPYPLATASVSGPTSEPTCWYLNRVLVHEGQRRHGHGRRVLQRLRDVCLERQNTHPDWPQVKSILVEPGGYGSKPEVLLK